MNTLDLHLRADRCTCGYHVESQGCHCDGSEWATFLAALTSAARDGVVHQRDVRPQLRGRIEPKHIGLLWKRARKEGLVREIDHERSDDTAGRNSHRMEAVYELRSAA